MSVVPHADKVIASGQPAHCRRCQVDLKNEKHWLGDSVDPTPHIAWKCDDCGYMVAELVDE